MTTTAQSPSRTHSTLVTPFRNRANNAGCPGEKKTRAIERDAMILLRASPMLKGYAKDLGLTCRDACVEIHGRLPSYYLKQMAQESLRHFTHCHGLRLTNETVVVIEDRWRTTRKPR